MNMENPKTKPVFREREICLSQNVFEILYCHFLLLYEIISISYY